MAAPGARPRRRPRRARLGRGAGAAAGAAGKALVLAAAAQAAGFDLVLAGAAGVVDAGGQLGVLLAGHLGVPCVTQAVGVAVAADGRGLAGGRPRPGPRLPRAGRGRAAGGRDGGRRRLGRARRRRRSRSACARLRGAVPRDPRLGPGRPRRSARAGACAPARRCAPAPPRPARPAAARHRRARLLAAGVRPHPRAGGGVGEAPRGPRRAAEPTTRRSSRSSRSCARGLARPPAARRRRRRTSRTGPARSGSVIPLEYRLRRACASRAAGDGSWRVVSELPLSVLRVNAAAARLLERTRGGVSVGRLAADLVSSRGAVPRALRASAAGGSWRSAPAPDRGRGHALRHRDRAHRDRARELADCLGRARGPGLSGGPARGHRRRRRLGGPGARWRASAAAHGARLLVNERNRGPAFSRNRAAREAAGELLAFVDSDCVAATRLAARAHAVLRLGAGGRGGRAHAWATTARRGSTATRRSPRRWTWARSLLLRGGRGRTACTCPPATCSCAAPCTGSSAGCARRCAWARTWTSAGACASAAACSSTRRRASCATSTSAVSGRCCGGARTTAAPRPRSTRCTRTSADACGCRRRRRRPWPSSPPPSSPAGRGCSPLRWRLRRWTRRAAARRLRRSGVDVPAAQVLLVHAARPPVGAVLRLLPAGALLPLAAGGRRGRRARRVAAGGARRRLRRRRRLHARAGPRLSLPAYLGFYVAEHAAYQTGVIAGHLGARLGRAPAVAPRAWSVEGTEAGMRT